MKGPVNIIKIAIISLIVIAVLCGAIVLAVSLFRQQEQGQNEAGILYSENPYAELFKLDEYATIIELAKEKGLTINEENEHYFAIENMEISGKLVSAGFTRSGDKIIAANGQFSTFEIDEQESIEQKIGNLQQEITWTSAFLGEILDTTILNYSIFGMDGFQIDPNASESYQAVLDGTANISISVKDQEGTYWEIESGFDHEGRLCFRYGHYFDAEAFKNVVANNVIS